MSIDWDKPVQTRDGRKVAIYTTNGKGKNYRVVGEYYLDTHWHMGRWTIDGKYVVNETDNNDLVNVVQKHTVWVNCYRDDCGSLFYSSWDSKAAAYEGSDSNRIACYEHTFTEGEGLNEH